MSTDPEFSTPDDALAPAETAPATPAAPAAPTTPATPPGPKKPWMNVYTVMLGVALLSVSLASLFLLLEWSRYGFDVKP